MNLAALGIGQIVETVGKVADDLFTSDKERLEIELKEKEIEAGVMKAQMAVNETEAKSASLFVAGWRPGAGWCGVAGLAYSSILQPLLAWFSLAKGWPVPPPIDNEVLLYVLGGLLGLGSFRTFEKVKGATK